MKTFKPPTWLIVVLAIVICFVPQCAGQITDINREQQGCERLNEVRVQLYTTLDIAATLVKDNENLVAAFRRQQRELIRSTETFAVETGSVTVDCEEAYPQPFPINYIDEWN